MTETVDYQDKKKRKSRDLVQEWVSSHVPLKYVKFVRPVPKGADKEPVYEFNIEAPRAGIDSKYHVDFIGMTDLVVVFRVGDENNIVPMANVIFARPL